MYRLSFALAAFCVFSPSVNPAGAQTPAELAQTAKLTASLQNPDGGFGSKAGAPSTLPATSSAIRILKNTGGSITDVLACIKYVRSCFDPKSGGFATTPGGKTDVPTTASGLMAVSELKIASDEIAHGGVDYLSDHAKTFEEVRIAVAGLEAISERSSEFGKWSEEILKTQKDDGTFGEGDARPRDTGGKAVALLRMGVKLDKKDQIVAFLKSAQKEDGGWSKGAGGSELETTYRIMRFFYMTREKPDLDRVASLVARCRHSDGSYGTNPEDAGSGGTYFATIVMRWVRILSGQPALTETAGFQPLFNGKDLDGWDGKESLWSAKDGVLVGRSEGLKNNEFLATRDSWANFVLKLNFRMNGSESSNSGVQFRSVRIPGHEMSGYQADIGQNFWGCLYDESRRNKVLMQASPEALKAINRDGWNHYVIDAKGAHIRLSLNGIQSVDYREEDPAIARDGRAAVQLHAGGPLTMEFKDIYIQALPDPKADDEATPGFHLRTLKSGGDDRKYTVYLPRGYDGTKAFPVVLFLHGSGERGTDGVVQSQVGLGPAILKNPDGFPAIAVFPQARSTWRAGSEDGRAALAILDEVLATFKADRERVVLTGLSMGGAGAWSIGAAHPERFAAVIPICGRGRTAFADSLKKVPVWAFCGDADRDRTVINGREMVEAVRAAGGKARLTEYRDVGHNSWDRAYNDPELVDWMLARTHQ